MPIGQQIQNRGTAVGIGYRADISFGLMHQDIDLAFFPLDGFAVNGNAVFAQIRFGSQLRNDFSVDGDMTAADQFFGFTPRGNAGRGQ